MSINLFSTFVIFIGMFGKFNKANINISYVALRFWEKYLTKRLEYGKIKY